jgi:hypothetical protein
VGGVGVLLALSCTTPTHYPSPQGLTLWVLSKLSNLETHMTSARAAAIATLEARLWAESEGRSAPLRLAEKGNAPPAAGPARGGR